MKTIICTKCGQEIELSEALTKDIENTVIAAEHEKHAAEIERLKRESAEAIAKSTSEAEAKARTEAVAKVDFKLQTLQKEADEAKNDNAELRKQTSELIEELRESKRARDNAEIEMQKKLSEEESKIREEATKLADEKQRLNIAAKEKTITDLQKALDDAQRKAAQGSQQLQGEVMELDIEEALTSAYRDDTIDPVAKGVKGGDIRHTVKSSRGTVCGVILWEIKRTKNWTDSWIAKLKEDLRAEKANIGVIISDVLPKELDKDMGFVDGIWVCKPSVALPSSVLLRKTLIDSAYQKALSINQDEKAGNLFGYITSHQFVQQIEIILETYASSVAQITKERMAFEKSWAEREGQAKRTLLSVANIVGNMQGAIGQTAMPRIKGMELLESGDESLSIE